MSVDLTLYQGLKTQEALLMCFDLETTGVNVDEDRIVQIAVSYFHQRRCIQQHTQLINPERPIPMGASEVHNIYDHHVQNQPRFKEFAPRLLSHFKGQVFAQLPSPVLVGYNILSYDLPLFKRELHRSQLELRLESIPSLDLILFVRWFLRHEPKQRLGEICDRFNVRLKSAHEALADARVCGYLINVFIDSGYIPEQLVDALKFQEMIRVRLEEEYSKYRRWIYHDRETQVMKLGVGKHIGSALNALDKGYFEYILRKMNDLPPAVHALFQERVR